MSNRLLKLSERIRSDVVDLESVIDRIMEGWQRSKRSGDDFYLDSDLILRKLKNLQLTPRVYSLISALNYLLSLFFCRKQHKKAKA